MIAVSFPPPLPYEGFPLRPHRNGQWYKSVWNPRTKKSEQFYFGAWADDPKGERALKDPQSGWLVRRDAIKAGVDNVNVQAAPSDMILGELMSRFLAHKRGKVGSGELSKTALGDYLSEIRAMQQVRHATHQVFHDTETSSTHLKEKRHVHDHQDGIRQ